MLAMGLVLGAIGLGVSSLQLSALLVTLAGPYAALLLLQRSEPEHIGILGAQLLLVDHGACTSSAVVPAFTIAALPDDRRRGCIHRNPPAARFLPAAIATRVAPVAAEGIRVDRKIVTVKLLQSRHPLALGAVAIAIAIASAAALLSLQGIFDSTAPPGRGDRACRIRYTGVRSASHTAITRDYGWYDHTPDRTAEPSAHPPGLAVCDLPG